MRHAFLPAVAFGALTFWINGALATDKFVVAVTSPTGWDSAVVDYGKRNGFFAEKDIDADVAATDAVSQNLQAVIAGSADIGIVSLPIFISAAMQGAPVKMIASAFKGTPDYLWYVRSDLPIHSFRDVTEKTRIGTSFLGSTGEILTREMLAQYGTTATVIGVGSGGAASMTQVMTGQLDMATDGNGLLGVPQYASGEVRPIAYGSEIEVMNNVTVRGFIVNADTLTARRDALVRFLQAYQKTVDWMYADPRAVQWFAEGTQSTLAEATRVRDHSYPPGHLNVEDVTGLEVTLRQSLAYKRIERSPTDAELANMFQMVWARPMQ